MAYRFKVGMRTGGAYSSGSESATNTRERGATLILFNLVCILVLIPFIGFAIDGSIFYWMRSKLSSAVDSCALATTRALNVGQTLDQQKAYAQSIGQQYFAANFPAGMMGTTVNAGSPNILITTDAQNTLIATVQASITVPTLFLRMLGFQSTQVSASGQASRRALNLMLVLDRSGSMGPPPGANVCGQMISAAQNFVNQRVEGQDQVGLITYQTTANLDFTPSTSFTSSITSDLATLQCAGATASADGLYLAYQEIKSTNLPLAMNVIVFFTDGQPNAIRGTFPIKTLGDTRYNPVNGQTQYYGPSPCLSSNALNGGVTTLWNSGTNVFYPSGVYIPPYPVAISSNAGKYISPVNGAGCNFYAYNTPEYMPLDIAYLPTQDANLISTTGYKALAYFPSGTPYQNQIRPDQYLNVRYVATNAADNIAYTIRNDTTYNTIIYTVGLGGAPDMPIDGDFLERVANDVRASNYDPTRPTGKFAYASNASELQAAFDQINSEILRLSQ